MLAIAVSAPTSGAATAAHQAVPNSRLRTVNLYSKVPLSFELNEGQTDEQVKFLSRRPGYTLFLTQSGAVLALRKRGDEGHIGKLTGKRGAKPEPVATQVLGVKLVGANPHTKIEGLEQLPAKANYFIGNDPKKWRANIATYARVRYHDVYPGIDVVYYGTGQGQLEYDFIVAPGTDPNAITLRLEGAKKLLLNGERDLVATLPDGGQLVQHLPAIYQERDGKREKVQGRVVLRGKDTVGFELAEYDRRRAIYIDPGLVYSTYLGGAMPERGGVVGDYAEGIAVDSAGDIYVIGKTYSPDFPTKDAFQSTCADCLFASGVFLTKIDPTASGAASLLYSTYLGGSVSEDGNGIAVDSAGDVYVTGATASPDFPVTANAFQSTLRGGSNAFVAKLDPTASGAAQLLYSTYLGGSGSAYSYGSDHGNGIAVDSAGNAYIVGSTDSNDFPVTPNAFQSACTSPVGCHGAFVAKIDPSASGAASLLYSTYLSGSDSEQNDDGFGIAVDSSGNAYITGATGSRDFPITPNAFERTCGECGTGQYYAFVAKLNPQASGKASLLYSTFFGGTIDQIRSAIAVDSSGNAYVTGTAADGFPVTARAFQKKLDGTGDAYVAKLNPAASGKASLLYSTLLGGRGDDWGTGIAVDSAGRAYVTGSTISVDFPVTSNAFQTRAIGSENAFVAKLNPAASGNASLVYSTYLGGTAIVNRGRGIAIDSSGNAYVTGWTEASDFPTTPNAFQSSPAEIATSFVTEINLAAADLTITPKTLSFGNRKVGTTTSKVFEVKAEAGKTSGIATVLLESFGVQSINGTGVWTIDPSTTCKQPNDSIPVREACKIVVDYTPTQATPKNQFDTASITITTNAETSPASGVVQLKGAGKASK